MHNDCADLASDGSDLDFDMLLSVPITSLAVFPATELLHDQFVGFGFADNFGSDNGPRNGGLAKLESGITGNGQDFLEFQFGTGFDFTEVQFKDLTFFDFILTATVCDDCVHIAALHLIESRKIRVADFSQWCKWRREPKLGK